MFSIHPSCKKSPCAEEPGLQKDRTRVRLWTSYVGVWGEKGKKQLGASAGHQETVYEGLCPSKPNPSSILFPVKVKLSLHPADGWLICTGGLLVAKTGYGAVKIRNSGDQNSQHGFQRIIFSMLSTAWYSLTDFFCCQEHPRVHQLTTEPKCCNISDIFSQFQEFSKRLRGDGKGMNCFVNTNNHYF